MTVVTENLTLVPTLKLQTSLGFHWLFQNRVGMPENGKAGLGSSLLSAQQETLRGSKEVPRWVEHVLGTMVPSVEAIWSLGGVRGG
jgi:hypothetical protein